MQEQFGQYRIQGLVGSGGMGEVYRAHDTRRDREVALKLLPSVLSDDVEYQRRFKRESYAVARLREPHVIPIHDYGEIDGRLFIDMRLVDGPNLGKVIAGGRLPVERAVNLVSQVAEALDAAHADGVVHRDVKPSNILVTRNDFVYVVDFGIAHAVGHTRSRLTMTGATLGTIDYMAPERFENRPVDARTDVYSLACVLYECVTGTKPFAGDDLPALMYAHLYTPVPQASTADSAVPAALDEVIAQGMAKSPAERYPTTGALASAARAAIGHPAEEPVTVGARAERALVPAPAGAEQAARGADTPLPRAAERPRESVAAGPSAAGPPGPGSPGSGASAAGSPGPGSPGSGAPAAASYDNGSTARVVYGAVTPDTGSGATVATYDPDDSASARTVGVAREPERPYYGPPSGPGGPPPYVPGPPASGQPPPPRAGSGRRLLVVVIVAALLLAVAGVAITYLLTRGSGATTGGVAAAPGVPTAGQEAPVLGGGVGPVARSVDVPTVGKTTPAGPTPGYLEIAPNGKFGYIANRAAGQINVFDTTSNSVTGTIPVTQGGPQFVAFAPDGKHAYVSIFNNDRTVNLVGVLNTETSQFEAMVPVGVRPFALEVTPDGKKVYVPNHDSSSISVIDTATNQVINTIKVAPNPHWVDITPDGKTMYAANHESNVVSVLDLSNDTVTTTIPVGRSPHSILKHPTLPILFNVNYDGNSLSIIDTTTNTVTKTVPVGNHPQDVSLSADGQHLYIVDVDDNAIQVLNVATQAITATITVGRSPTSIAVGKDGRQAYVTDLADGTVTVLNIAGTA